MLAPLCEPLEVALARTSIALVEVDRAPNSDQRTLRVCRIGTGWESRDAQVRPVDRIIASHALAARQPLAPELRVMCQGPPQPPTRGKYSWTVAPTT